MSYIDKVYTVLVRVPHCIALEVLQIQYFDLIGIYIDE